MTADSREEAAMRTMRRRRGQAAPLELGAALAWWAAIMLLTLVLAIWATWAQAQPFGVHASGGKRPDMPATVADLGAAWVRVNAALDGTDADPRPFLDAGANLLITVHYADPANVDTTYGTPAQWPNAGFPYRTKAAYQQRLADFLTPLLPYFAQGRAIWVQAENEIGDAAVQPDGKYWRGTTDQYLIQLAAFAEAVRALHPALSVVLTSFASQNLAVAIDPTDPKYAFQTGRMTKLLTQGAYDVADGHFYGCLEDTDARIGWLTSHLPAGKRWIASELSGPDSTCPTTPHSWRDGLAQFEQQEAAQVAPRLSACADAGGAICMWFSLFDLENEVDQFNHLGLVDGRVTPPRQKPAYAAFKAFVAANADETVDVVEYYAASLDHYFITAETVEIAVLDSGTIPGWARTGLGFAAHATATAGANPVCRFYLPPAYGDSHFYSASPAECAAVRATYPGFVYESPAVFYESLPDAITGACPGATIPVYRVWDRRADTNHRYTIDRAVRDAMVARGWVAEGYGPDAVIMCAPQ